MNTLDAIFSRKSIRSLTGEMVSKQTLDTILKAGEAAPVGMGKYESLHFTVISDPDLLAKLGGKALYGAPTLILVSTAKPAPGMENLAYSNAAIAVENMALAATDLGAGACHIWGAVMQLKDKPDLVASLNLPAGFVPACALAVGETANAYSAREIDTTRIATDYIG